MTLSEKATLSMEEVSTLLASGSVSPQEDIDKLQASASLLDAQIKALVLDNRELLLEETARVRDAGKDFQKLFLSVRSLQSVASRVKASVAEPQAQLLSKTRELANVYRTVAVLRQVTHQIKLVQRIKAEYESHGFEDGEKGNGENGGSDSNHGQGGNGEVGGKRGAAKRDADVDLPKLARLLADAEQAWEEADLTGIQVCEDNQKFVLDCKSAVRVRAMELLELGVESRSQTDIGGALLALHGLGELRQSLDSLVQDMVQRVKKRFMRSLDPKRFVSSGGLGGIGGIGATQSEQDESKVWEELEKSMEELRESALSAWCLEKVLRKKRDISNLKLIDLVDEAAHPFVTFWMSGLERVKDAFESVMVSRNRIVRDTLVGQYQRLARLLDGTLASIVRETTDGRRRTITDDLASKYYDMVASIESEYLKSIQARLESLALTAFPGGSRPLPSQVDLQALNARFFEEMKRAQRGGERIVALTAAVLGTVLLSVAAQARDMGEVVNVNTVAAQERNLALAKNVEDLSKNAVIMCSKLLAGAGPPSFKSSTSSGPTASAKAARAIQGPADVLKQTSRELLEPMFKSKTEQLKNIIKKMHAVNFAAAEGAESEVATPSSYILELETALEEFGRTVLRACGAGPSGDPKKYVALGLLCETCDSLVRCWVLHASLVRPLTAPGKLQLAKDAAELENGLRQLLARINTMQLSAFKKLLFTSIPTSPDDASGADNAADLGAMIATLGKTVTLHHLFSRLPEQISSPYARSKLSPAQYYVWVEDNTEKAVLKQIETALTAAAVNHPVVQRMKSLLCN